MSSTPDGADRSDPRYSGRRYVDMVADSLTLKIASFGLLLLVLAVLMDTFLGMSEAAESETASYDLWGLWAGIFGVWGGALLAVGTLSFVVITWKRR